MDTEAEVIIQLPRGSSIDRHLREEPPASVGDRRVVLEHLAPGEDGRLTPPAAGEVVLTVSSPEALRRDYQEIERVVLDAAQDSGPLVVLVEGAEYLREEEITAVLDAAAAAKRVIVLRILAGV